MENRLQLINNIYERYFEILKLSKKLGDSELWELAKSQLIETSRILNEQIINLK